MAYSQKFLDSWSEKDEFKDWLKEEDKENATCTWCNSSFLTSNKGVAAIKPHANTDGLKKEAKKLNKLL